MVKNYQKLEILFSATSPSPNNSRDLSDPPDPNPASPLRSLSPNQQQALSPAFLRHLDEVKKPLRGGSSTDEEGRGAIYPPRPSYSSISHKHSCKLLNVKECARVGFSGNYQFPAHPSFSSSKGTKPNVYSDIIRQCPCP